MLFYDVAAKSEKAAIPAWVALPRVFYLDLPGSQTAAFRLQPQLPDEFSLIAFEVRCSSYLRARRAWTRRR